MLMPNDKWRRGGPRPPDDGDAHKGNLEASQPPSDFEQLFLNLYDAAILCDLTGKVIHANYRATELLLFTCSALRKMTIYDVISGLDADQLGVIRRVLEDQRYVLITEAYCIRRDKTVLTTEIAVTKLQLKRDCLVFFIRDITLRQQMEEQLKGKG